jgi:uncharacterized membrane protein YozB (DUF420 family)
LINIINNILALLNRHRAALSTHVVATVLAFLVLYLLRGVMQQAVPFGGRQRGPTQRHCSGILLSFSLSKN